MISRIQLVVLCSLLVACSAAPQTPTPHIPTSTSPPTATPPPTPTPVPPRTIWVDPVLPTDVHDPLRAALRELAHRISTPARPVTVSIHSNADVRVVAGKEGLPLVTRVYALAAPFPTIADGLTFEDFRRFWAGEPHALAYLSNDRETPPTLFMDAHTRAGLVFLLGPPAESLYIRLVPTEQLLKAAWENQPAFAVLPFDQLSVQWKLLHLDGVNLFEREADLSRYPLVLHVSAQGDPALLAEIGAALPPQHNRDLKKMAIVAMTGVTALVRGTAVRMEEKGITYPAEKIRDWLLTADVTHISNEVSFWERCPPPSFSSGIVMCSSPRYIELLRYVGTDVIELTGNHLWDYGYQNLIPTLEMYAREGWGYFGGGRNLDEALRPLTMTVNGNRLAFVGCNYFGANWAREDVPGSAPCTPGDPRNLSYQIQLIRQLKAEGYHVIATLQYEEYYFYEATPQQRRDFAALRDAGATIVNGSQGHHAQGFDVSADGFIHWGVGNLFFGDQRPIGARQTMVDRHVFYDNRYLGVDLRTAFIEDFSQPRPMTAEERADLLRKLFAVSVFVPPR